MFICLRICFLSLYWALGRQESTGQAPALLKVPELQERLMLDKPPLVMVTVGFILFYFFKRKVSSITVRFEYSLWEPVTAITLWACVSSLPRMFCPPSQQRESSRQYHVISCVPWPLKAEVGLFWYCVPRKWSKCFIKQQLGAFQVLWPWSQSLWVSIRAPPLITWT